MDLDFRASSIHSANYLSTVQAERLHSESDSPNEQPQADSFRQSLDRLKLDLASISVNEGLRSYDFAMSAAYYNVGDEGYDENPEDDPNSDNYSVPRYTDEEDDDQSVFRCPFCDFEIDVSVLRCRLEEEHYYDPKNAVCPVCGENLGTDAIGLTQHSNSRKRTWKSEKSSIWSGNSAMLGKKHAARGNKHEAMPDPLLSPFICNMSVPNASGVLPDEDFINNASDISNLKSSGKDAPDMGDEQDHQERRLRAAFVQQLVLSTIF